MVGMFDDWEQEAWKPPPEEFIDEWAERCLVLPRSVSSVTGPLSLELTPFIREPLRAVTDPVVEEVALCCSTQVVKTTFLLIVALHFLRCDPWNMYHVMPAEDEALEVKHERYEPIIRESPELRALVNPRDRGQFAGDVIRLNGCTITFRGSHSASGLASKPAKIAIADEIDKWEAWTGKEADPLDLLGERLKTFHDSKFLKCSTPTTESSRIMAELESSTNERYHVPCPHCGTAQVLVFGDGTPSTPGIKWPQDTSPDEIEHRNLAWYECAQCHKRIDESEKRAMVSAGSWVPTNPQASRRKVGYHLWAGYSLWPKAGWSKIAARFLRSKDRPIALMNFRNSWLAETWKQSVGEMREDQVRACLGDYWIEELPPGADVVTFGVDVQSVGNLTYHYYVVRAWGPDGESWLVKYGTTTARRGGAPGWDGLNSVIFDIEYRCADGTAATKIVPLVDSGYRTAEVYDWCFENSGIATKGDARSRKHINYSQIARAPESEDLVEFVSFNPDYYKQELHRRIRQPERWHLPREMDEEYFAHMTAEQPMRVLDRKSGRHRVEWKLKSDGLPNHYFDCEVLNLVAADLAELGSRGAKRREEPEGAPRREQAPPLKAVETGQVRIFS